MALIDNDQNLQLHKYSGKVAVLEKAQHVSPIYGCSKVSRTRVGQPTASLAGLMLIHTRLATVLQLFTMALLKITKNCVWHWN